MLVPRGPVQDTRMGTTQTSTRIQLQLNYSTRLWTVFNLYGLLTLSKYQINFFSKISIFISYKCSAVSRVVSNTLKCPKTKCPKNFCKPARYHVQILISSECFGPYRAHKLPQIFYKLNMFYQRRTTIHSGTSNCIPDDVTIAA